MLPPVSLPIAKPTNPAAVAAPGPALDPDEASSSSHGFMVCPPNQMSLSASAPRLSLATSTAPAVCRRFTTTASSLGTRAMTLCWSLDKLGPMTRTVEDAMLVLHAITGPDAGDVASVPSHLDFDASASVAGLRVGYFPRWMNENPATAVDRAAVDVVKKVGMVPVEVSIPDWPYDSLDLILFAEGAAAFEELTLSGGLRELKAQVPDAWPNIFRQARFLSAVDFVQADRLRRKVAEEMARLFSQVGLLLVPSVRDEMLTITNFTGHPALVLRAGFVEAAKARSDWAPDPNHPLPTFNPPRRVPHGVTLIGRLFDEGPMVNAGMALERAFGVVGERPPGF